LILPHGAHVELVETRALPFDELRVSAQSVVRLAGGSARFKPQAAPESPPFVGPSNRD